MKDIAIATGVSRSTVSRILNNAPISVPIAQETRERVLAAARDLEYRPNPLARALRGAPTMLLGAIVRDITDPFFAGAVEGVSSAARARGYNIVLGLAHARATEAFELATILEARQCDGIILLGDMGDQPRLLADLRHSHVPVVAMWQGTLLDLIPGVQVDNHLGTRIAIEHLRGLGHRRIAFIGGRLLGDIRERQAAYSEVVSEILGDVPAGYLQQVANTPEGGETALGALLRLSPRPTAIVASTDVLAIGVLRGALLRGVKVPTSCRSSASTTSRWHSRRCPVSRRSACRWRRWPPRRSPSPSARPTTTSTRPTDRRTITPDARRTVSFRRRWSCASPRPHPRPTTCPGPVSRDWNGGHEPR